MSYPPGTVVLCELNESRFFFNSGDQVTLTFPGPQTGILTGLSVEEEGFDLPDSVIIPQSGMVTVQGTLHGETRTYEVFEEVAESIIRRSKIISVSTPAP
jgi:hypothetical protein